MPPKRNNPESELQKLHNVKGRHWFHRAFPLTFSPCCGIRAHICTYIITIISTLKNPKWTVLRNDIRVCLLGSTCMYILYVHPDTRVYTYIHAPGYHEYILPHLHVHMYTKNILLNCQVPLAFQSSFCWFLISFQCDQKESLLQV